MYICVQEGKKKGGTQMSACQNGGKVTRASGEPYTTLRRNETRIRLRGGLGNTRGRYSDNRELARDSPVGSAIGLVTGCTGLFGDSDSFIDCFNSLLTILLSPHSRATFTGLKCEFKDGRDPLRNRARKSDLGTH